MTNAITLTREEAREACRSQAMHMCEEFPGYKAEVCGDDPEKLAHCALCKRLTEFAKGEEDE